LKDLKQQESLWGNTLSWTSPGTCGRGVMNETAPIRSKESPTVTRATKLFALNVMLFSVCVVLLDPLRMGSGASERPDD
jgi:hypothetical protein